MAALTAPLNGGVRRCQCRPILLQQEEPMKARFAIFAPAVTAVFTLPASAQIAADGAGLSGLYEGS